MSLIKESDVFLDVKIKKVVSKDMGIFYNPIMKLNRDIAVLLLSVWNKKNLRIADLMAGSGIRTIRFFKELGNDNIESIWCNDLSSESFSKIEENLRINKIFSDKLDLSCEDANSGLLKRKGFDYIEIDPFGSPNPFLDNAIKRLSRSGILAVTATDTSALTGTYKNACMKKYWSVPLKNYFMHETSLRILIRKIQLVALQYEKPLVPVFCHSSNHYVRVYLILERSKKKNEFILNNHKFILWNPDSFEIRVSDFKEKEFVCAGPVWTGSLFDKKFVKKMLFEAKKKGFSEAIKLLSLIDEESSVDMLGYYDLHKIFKKLKISGIKTDLIIDEIKKKGFDAVKVHSNLTGIKTKMPLDKLFNLFNFLKKFS
jgi:tRNA (guanine26-N2/guanine27-N2)-dimethyltransferase